MAGSHLLLTLLGGVALLVWSVRMVRTGMSRAFGARLRTVLTRASGNRLSAFGAGIAITTLLQSSTAMALLLASFASRGLIALPIALATMLGADVGTTLVAQLVAFDVKSAWAPLMLIGVVMFNSLEGDVWRGGGRILIGLALMLLGLTVIGSATGELRDSALLKSTLVALGSDPLLAVLVGALFTWLVHSSLAMVLFVMSLAAGRLIGADLALALILGANLGGAIAPFSALSRSTVAARRVPLGNLIARAAGVLVIFPVMSSIVPLMTSLSSDPARQALNFHILFNFGLAVCGLVLLTPLATAAQRILPDEEAPKDARSQRNLDPSVLNTPTEALACAMRETLNMGDIVLDMLQGAQKAIEGNDLKAVREVEKTDNDVDARYEAIKLYLIRASKTDMGEDDSRRYVEVLTFTTNLEHVGDIIDKNLMELAAKKIKKGYAFSPEGLAELRRFHGQVAEHMRLALNVFATRDVTLARRLLRQKSDIRFSESQASERHFDRLKQGRMQSIETSSIHLDIIRDLKRINSHLTSVAYPILEAAGELVQSRLREVVRESEDKTAGTVAPVKR